MPNATMIALAVWSPFLFFAVIFGITFAVRGFRRGSIKAAISLGVTLISTLLSILAAKLVAGIVAPRLEPFARDMLGDALENFEGAHIDALVTGCVTAICSLVLFIPCFMLVLIIFKNLTSGVFTKKIPGPEKTASKVGGLAIGVADALLLSFLLLLPVYGSLNMGGNILGAISAIESMENKGEETLSLPLNTLSTGNTVRPMASSGMASPSGTPSYEELLNAIVNTPLADIAGLPIFNTVYDEMASFTSPDGEKVSVTKTVNTATKVVTAAVSYKNGEEGGKNAMLDAMDHLETVMTESSFFAGLAGDVIATTVLSDDSALPVQYEGFTDKTVLQNDLGAIFTVARAAVESDLLSELMTDKPDLSKVDVKTFATGVSTALNSTESIAQLKADIINTVIDTALESIAGDDEEKLATLRDSIGTVDAAPLTGDALTAESDSLYLIMNAALSMTSKNDIGSMADTSKAAGDLIEGLARHPSFGVDKVVDVAGAILDVSGATGEGDEAMKESIKETLKDALNNSVSKPVGEATFGEFVGTTASAAEILTQIQNGSVDVKTMEQILNARPDVLQQLEETLTGELLASLGLEGEASDVMVSLAHALFGSLRENDMTADEKKAEAVVLSDALALIFNIGKDSSTDEEGIKATAYTLARSYLKSKIICATAKSLSADGADPFGLNISEEDKAEIRPVFLEAIAEFADEDPNAAEKIGYLATLMGVTLN